MKTIEEAAKEYADKEAMDFPTGTMSNDEVSDWLNSAFKAGVKFANRWIPVEEEVPELIDSCADRVLACDYPNDPNDARTSRYQWDPYSYSNKMIWVGGYKKYDKPKYWRPIDIK